MRKSFIITQETLSECGLIYENMEERITNPMILRVQDVKLKPILCEELYVQILDFADDIEAETAIPAEFTNLIENFIQPYLMTEIEKKIIIYNTSKIANKTTGKNNDQHMSANDVPANNHIRNDIKGDIVVYRNNLVQFLRDNIDLYPLYEECDCEEQEGKQTGYTNLIGFVHG